MYYWKQIHFFNSKSQKMFRLIGPKLSKDFESYEELYSYCQKNNIDAKTV